MKLRLFIPLLLATTLASAQDNSFDYLPNHTDIGKPKMKGSTVFNLADQTYTLSGGGYNIWFNRDEFHFAYRKIKGDFLLTANVKLGEDGKDPHRKIGWTIRESLDEDAAHISATLHGDGLTVLQWRKLRGAYMRDPQDEIFFLKKHVQIIQLERKGNIYTMRAANPGEPLQTVGVQQMPDMPDEVFAGLFLCSHNPDAIEKGSAWNVRIEKTVGENYDANRNGFLCSQLETVNVFDGNRKIIYQSTDRFEAPNWMPDGKRLLFNQGGFIYTIPLDNPVPEKLNTGFADKNNNDHVISFNGKMLGISHQRQDMTEGGSTIYTVPLTGGDPVLVTDSTPSYLHGWNPNNKEVVYVAKRPGTSPVYNVFKKAIIGGKEVQLTFNTTAHSDGPEYSPDGKFIYYNTTKTGTMQLWRMKPDGTGNEQLTFDEYNNWFPHISPDGKWILFLSFLSDVAPGDHPFYKKVMLRLMPANGGAPRAVAYLYGGQGTINTPSWSPDSKHVAFVSNSLKLD